MLEQDATPSPEITDVPDDQHESDPETTHHDPARPPAGGIDWRVFVGVGVAIAGFLIAIAIGLTE